MIAMILKDWNDGVDFGMRDGLLGLAAVCWGLPGVDGVVF